MTRHLKCLNGPLRGEIFVVGDRMKQDDTVHLPTPDSFNVYVVGELYANRQRIRYLYHIGSTEAEALKERLEP